MRKIILEKQRKSQVFISYSHKDEGIKEYLEEHLSVLSKQEKLCFWSDKQIELGDEWSHEITKELDEASVAILLLSRHFLSSNFIMDNEVPLFLEKREKGELEILFLMLSPCAWREVSWIEMLQGFPRDNYPLSGMNSHEQDEALVEFALNVQAKCNIQEKKYNTLFQKKTNGIKNLFHLPYESKADGAIAMEDKLIELENILNQPKKYNRSNMAVIQGIGGLGKTQLAVEYAHNYKNDYSGVIWLTMDQDIDDQLIDLAVSAGWVDRDVDAKVKLNRAKDFYSQLDGALLIYDNVEKYKEVELYLPKSTNNKILITSRNIVQGFPIVSLDILNKDNSLKLLSFESKRNIMQEELDATINLVSALGGLPLALEMAGALVYSLDLNWNDYWENFQEEGVKFLDESDIRGITKHESNIGKTLLLGDELLEENPILEQVINLLAWGALEPMDKTLLSKMLNENKSKLAVNIQKGIKLKFIKVEDNEENQVVYTLHRLVSEVWRRQHKLDTLFVETVSKNLISYMQAIKNDFLNIRELDMASFQAVKWAEKLENNIEFQSQLICYAAYSDNYLANYTKALKKINKAYKNINNSIDSLVYLEILNFKGALLKSLGDAKKAESYYIRALEMGKKLYPNSDNTEIAISLSGLGSILKSLGKFEEAQYYYDKALEMRQRIYPDKDHPDLATSLRHKCFILNSLEDFKNAQPYYKNALEMRQRLYPNIDHPDLIDSLRGIRFILNSLGDSKSAEPYYKQALEMGQRLYPDTDHPDIASALNNLGSIVNSLGDSKSAQPYYKDALEMRQRLYLGVDHPEVSNSLNNMGSILNYLGELKEAQHYYMESLEMRQRLYPNVDHPNVASSFNNMGFILDSLGDQKEAKPYYLQALEMRKRLYPDTDHPDIANSLSGMGSVSLTLGNIQDAKNYYNYALEMLQRLYPNIDHPDIASFLNNMAFIMNSLDKKKESKIYYEKALKMRQRLYPNVDHPDVASSLSDMGFIINSLGDLDEAKIYYSKALEMRQRLYPNVDHPDVANSLNNMGMLYKKLKQYEKSKEFMLKTIDMLLRIDYDPIRLKTCQDNLKIIEENIKK